MPVSAGIYYCKNEGDYSGIPPVVLIHGMGGNHLCWPSEVRRLKHYTILGLDLPGHGKSEGFARQSVEEYANDIIVFLETLGIYRTILVGHSMGAAIALKTAVLIPERVTGMVLAAGGAYLGGNLDLYQQLINPHTLHNAFKLLEENLFGRSVSADLIEKSCAMMRQTRPGVWRGDALACSKFDIRGRLPRLEIPTWVVIGNQDRLIPLSSASFLSANLPGARVDIFSEVGHMLMLETPQKFAEGLNTFLGKVISVDQGIKSQDTDFS
jgi:3-oxoadipate enol-lactonase